MVHLPRVDLSCYLVSRLVFSFDLHFFFASFVVGSFFCNLCLLFSPSRTDLFVVVSHMIILAIVARVDKRGHVRKNLSFCSVYISGSPSWMPGNPNTSNNSSKTISKTYNGRNK